ARPWPRTFAESIRAAPASSCSRRGPAPRPPCPQIFRCMPSARPCAWEWTGGPPPAPSNSMGAGGAAVADATTPGPSSRAHGGVAWPAARWLGAEHDQAGRVLVRPDLSVPNHPEIFVIGDAAAVHDEKGAMAPGVAPAAKQMGRYVGRLIAARGAGKSSPPPFRY